MRWRIYYGDGSTFDDTAGEPNDAPAHGVVAVVYPDLEVGRFVLHQWDWYYCKNGEWWGSDTFGLLDQMMHFAPQITAIKQGRTFTNPEYRTVLGRAIGDPDFPPKSARTRGETP